MLNKKEIAAMKAIAICFKPYLKPEEAMIYCSLGRTQLAKKCAEFLVFKNNSGYFTRLDLNRMMAGDSPEIAAKTQDKGRISEQPL